MARPRFIVVDDTDPSIQYQGTWFQDYSGSQNGNGNRGQTYRNTLHGTNSNASFTFSFSGTQIQVFGTSSIVNISAGQEDPSWECSLDDISLPVNNDSPTAENNWRLCGQHKLKDGVHTLIVNVTVLQSHTFWLDKIFYAPSLSVPLDGKAIRIDNTDPELLTGFDPTWSAPIEPHLRVNLTSTTNSTYMYNFTGVSLSWYGINQAISPNLATTGTYTVDQNDPTRFFIRSLPRGTRTTAYNQVLFHTPQFSQGSHQLVVQFEGNQTTVPLTLDYLIVYNGSTSTGPSSSNSSFNQGPSSTGMSTTAPSLSSAVNDPSHSTTSDHLEDDHTHSLKIGLYVGIAVAGGALVAIVTWLMFRHKKKKQHNLLPRAFPFFHTNLPTQKSSQDLQKTLPSLHAKREK